jgi:hypothetical protein
MKQPPGFKGLNYRLNSTSSTDHQEFSLVSIGIIIMYGKMTLNSILRIQNAEILRRFNELRKTQFEEFSVSVAAEKFLDQQGSY